VCEHRPLIQNFQHCQKIKIEINKRRDLLGGAISMVLLPGMDIKSALPRTT
jgi:hypothetical protein